MKNLFFYCNLLYNVIGDDMKKILFYCMLIFMIFSLTGCNSIYDKYQVKEEYKSGKSYKETIEITYDEYNEKIKNEETFIILLWQTGCAHCESYEPKLNKIIKKYNLEIYSLNLKNLDEKEKAIIKNKTFMSGTPTTVFIKNGKYISKIIGNQETESILNFLIEAGYLEEKQVES